MSQVTLEEARRVVDGLDLPDKARLLGDLAAEVSRLVVARGGRADGPPGPTGRGDADRERDERRAAWERFREAGRLAVASLPPDAPSLVEEVSRSRR